MLARSSISIFALVLCVVAFALPESGAAQSDPGFPVEAVPEKQAAAPVEDPVAVAAYGMLFDEHMKVINPSPEFMRKALDLYIKRLTDKANAPIRTTLEKHRQHVQAMLAFCRQQTPPGGEVPPPNTKDDPQVISPPIVIGPLYACVEAVEVRSGIYGAKLTVSVNGTAAPSVTVTTPSRTIVPVPALVTGQMVNAVQEVSGAPSIASNTETVIDHTVAYPSGLPLPVIDPTVIYQCGNTIAVRHVRGANVTVFTNGANDVTYTTGGDWTNLPPAIRPFVLNDSYTAQQSLCTDKSGISLPQSAGTPPSPMPVPALDPVPPIAGQQVVNVTNLANGALTTVSENSAGVLSTFSTAVSWIPEVDVATALGRPLQSGDQLAVVSSLCEDAKVSIPEARPCERLAAPRIATPLVGQTFVNVTDAVPGAHSHLRRRAERDRRRLRRPGGADTRDRIGRHSHGDPEAGAVHQRQRLSDGSCLRFEPDVRVT